jgi:hypothetical protein
MATESSYSRSPDASFMPPLASREHECAIDREPALSQVDDAVAELLPFRGREGAWRELLGCAPP